MSGIGQAFREDQVGQGYVEVRHDRQLYGCQNFSLLSGDRGSDLNFNGYPLHLFIRLLISEKNIIKCFATRGFACTARFLSNEDNCTGVAILCQPKWQLTNRLEA
jgi:hypothetical protein